MRRSAKGLSLVLAGILAGTVLLTPVSAHITQNGRHVGVHAWREFISKRVYTRRAARRVFYTRTAAKRVFYTRTAANDVFQSKCQDGAVLAYATVDADAGFSETFTSDGVTAFNCTGGAVEVRRLVQGFPTYHVKFTGLGTTNQLLSNAQVSAAQATAAFGIYDDDGTAVDDSFTVRMFDASGTGVDADFALTIFRAG